MKFIETALSIGCMTLSAVSFAGTKDIITSNNQICIQSISTRVDYTETGGSYGIPAGILDTETGWVSGYGLSISTMRNLWLGNDYLAAKYSNNDGNTNYVGALLSGGNYGSYVSTSRASLTDYSFRYGKGFTLDKDTMATPYLELGHHQWERGVNYGETYTHYHFGLGVLGQYSPVGQLVFTANALIGSTAGSYISVAGPGGFAGALGNSPLFQAGISVDYEFAQNFHGNIGIDYTSFRYGASNLYPAGSGIVQWEPDSSTKYTILKLGLGYAY